MDKDRVSQLAINSQSVSRSVSKMASPFVSQVPFYSVSKSVSHSFSISISKTARHLVSQLAINSQSVVQSVRPLGILLVSH